MARLFAAGSSESLVVNTAPVTAAPFTMAAWARCTDGGTAFFRRVVSIGDKDVTNHWWSMYFREFFGQNVVFEVSAGVSSATAVSSTNWTDNQWHHICAVEASATSHTIYLDGAGAVTSVTSLSPAGADQLAIGVPAESLPAASEYFTGDIAEVAIWNAALSAADVALLFKRTSPYLVVPQSLVTYTRIMGRYSPEIDERGGLSLTATGTVVAAHPRIYYPPHHLKGRWIKPAAAATIGGPLVGGRLANSRLLVGGRLAG